MSKAQPKRKLKQTDLLSSFQQSRKEQTARDDESRQTSQASDNVQETVTPFKVEMKEGHSKHRQQRAKKQNHKFQFRFSSEIKPVFVVCDISMTVLDALNTSDTFRMNKNVKNPDKEMVIQRADRAAVKTDFPCRLIEKDEILDITFIKRKGNPSTDQQKHDKCSLSRTDIVAFKIKTTGGEKVKYVMKNSELRKRADYVCVYAFKDEEVETVLERDGRFIDKIFQKHCVLSLEFKSKAKKGQQSRYEMSSPVEHLDKNTFQIIAIGARRPDNQTKQTKVETESDVASNTKSGKNYPDLHPISSEQKQTTQNAESTSLTKWTIIPDSENILQILRDQCKDLMDKIKKQKNLINNFQLQRVLREECDKSVQIFSEVYKVKELMRLSDSVCQIQVDGSPRGTGFLLFGQFILTNAHVVRECVEAPDRLLSTRNVVAVFDFDHENSIVTVVPVKRRIPAYCFMTDQLNHLDYALLELDAVDEITHRPELISCYSPGPPPNCGSICIVGHPDGGVKRTDYGFIIGKENLLQADIRRVSENVSFIHMISQRSFKEQCRTWNQITYNSCFFHGSSGSPVFDEHCKLIGVHTGGYVYPGESRRTMNIIEYAYPMQPILDMIRAQTRIRGRDEIVNILEAFRLNLPEAAEQQNQEDYEMEEV